MTNTSSDEMMELVKKAASEITTGKAQVMGLVRCTGFQCFGIKGADGFWRDAHGHYLGVIEIVRTF